MMNIYDLIGLAGISLSVFCYGRVQWRRDYAKTMTYSALNLVSAFLLGVSLFHTWNLAAFVNNLIWALISIYGVWRCFAHPRRTKSKR